jgi:phage portal protein BeeE
MGLISRFRAVVGALKGEQQLYVSSTVRPYELHVDGRFRRYHYEEMLKRWQGWFAVAQSRNACAVASLKWTVVRDSRYGKTGFKTKKPGMALRKHMTTTAGQIARRKAYQAGDNIEEITDPNHPLVRILENPNPFMGYFELCEMTEQMQGACGDFGWYNVYGDNGWPVEFWPMYPQFMRVVADEQNIIKEYVYGRGPEIEHHFPAEDVWLFKRPNPFGDPYRGLSDLYKCAASVDLSTMFDSYAINALKNAVQPGLIIADERLDAKKQKEVHAALMRRAGTQNAAKDLLLQLGEKAKILPWEAGQKEAGFLGGASDDATMKKIAAACDIPPDILVMGPTSLAHGETAMPHWQKYGIRPRAQRYEDTINRNIPYSFAKLNDPGLMVIIEDSVTEDQNDIAERNKIMIDAGAGTVNEFRAEMGRAPVEGGDDVRDPMEMEQAKMDHAAEQADKDRASAEKQAKSKPDPKAAAKSFVRDSDRTEHDPLESLLLTMFKERHGITKAVTPPAEGDEPPEIKAIGKAALAWLTDWFSDWARKARGGSLPGHASQVAEWAFVRPEDAMKLAERLMPSLRAGVKVGIDMGMAELPESTTPFVVEASRVEQYLDSVTGRLVESVTKTVDEQLREVLIEKLSGGSTGPELVEAVSAVMRERTVADAERIAVTEGSQVLHGGAIIAWEKSGAVVGKKWLLSGNPCHICRAIAKSHNTAALDAPFVPLGATIKTAEGDFTVKYRDIMHPPAHPRCRCDMVPVFREE